MNPHPADVSEARALAELVLLETGNDDERAPDPVIVAGALGILMLEVPSIRLAGARGLTTWAQGGYVIEVDENLSESARQSVAAHELGHVCCRLWNITPHDWERFAWIFSAAMLVRADVAADLWRERSSFPHLIAQLPHVPPTSIALALGEHGIADVAVTQWKSIRYTRARAPVPEETIRAGIAAARSGAARRGSVRAWRLDDMPGRAAVVVDARLAG